MENIEECTKTKSILSVLGPIAQKIIQLKNHDGAICEAHIILQLLKQCEALKFACHHLKEHLVTEAQGLGDPVFLKEIHQLHQPLVSCIENLTESTKDLHRGDVQVKDNGEVWTQLITCAEDILGCLIRILLSWDHAHQRRINYSLDNFLLCVNSLQDLSLDQMPLHFEEVVDAIEEVFHLVEERSNNICRAAQREALFILTLQLQKMLPFLAFVIMRGFCSPECNAVKACRSLVEDEIKRLIQNIRKEMGLGSQKYNLQEPANYINTLNELFKLLTVSQGENGIDKLPLMDTIKSSVEIVLQHSICIALYGSSQDYSSIMTASESVLHQMKILSKIENSQYPNPSDVDVVLDVIVDVLEVLEMRVNSSLVRLIVQCFSDPFAHLEALLKASKANPLDAKEDRTNLNALLSPLVVVFQEEMDKFYQIGGLIIACISDPSKVREIESSLAMMGWLETVLVSAIHSLPSGNNVSSLAQVLIFSHQWMNEVISFRRLIFSLLELDTLLKVTKQEIHKIWADVRDKCSGSVWSKVKLALSYVHCLLRLNEDSLYLTEIQKEDLIRAVTEVKKVSSSEDDDLDDNARRRLVKRLQVMLTVVSRLSTSFSRSTLVVSQPEDLFGCHVYEAGFSAAMKQLSECSAQSDGLISDPSDVSLLPESSSKHNSSTDPAMKSSRKDRFSTQSVFKDKSLKATGLRSSKATKRLPPKLQVQPDPEDSVHKTSSDSHISIDITKFLLSRSTNTFRNSTRASKRNISIKVKEMNLDIGEVVRITPKAQVPRYVVPCMLKLTNYSSNDFSEALRKMENFTSSLSTSINPTDERKRIGHTFGGHDGTKQFNLRHLFYHTFQPLFSTVDNTSSLNPKLVALVEELENVFITGDSNNGLQNDIADKLMKEDLATTLEWNPKSFSNLSSSDLVTSIGTPNSLQINTPERLDDLDLVRCKLASLKCNFTSNK